MGQIFHFLFEDCARPAISIIWKFNLITQKLYKIDTKLTQNYRHQTHKDQFAQKLIIINISYLLFNNAVKC